MAKELESLRSLQTFTLVDKKDLPSKTQILDTTYVFTLKNQGDQIIHKARLYVRGDQEQTDHQLADIFSTVARSENLRLLLTVIVSLNWDFYVCDVKNAFVNAVLTKPSYVKIPPCAEGDRNHSVWKLNKALYGLRRSPAEWNSELSKTLMSLGFYKAKSDCNLFFKMHGSKKVYLAFHVDDGLITSNDTEILDDFVD
jgi:hypothetical protein